MQHLRLLTGDEVQLAAQRDGPKLSFSLADVRRSPAPSSLSSHGAAAAVLVSPAPRPPWLRPGAGIDDPAVWSVKKCQQLLGQMLMRAPGAKFPPIYKDLALMQVRMLTWPAAGGLCTSTSHQFVIKLASPQPRHCMGVPPCSAGVYAANIWYCPCRCMLAAWACAPQPLEPSLRS